MAWPRLISLVGMLAVMFMIMNRAKDPSTWRWLAGEADLVEQSAEVGDSPSAARNVQDERGGDSTAVAPLPYSSDDSSQATDQDPEEADAAREEFQALSDRTPLLPEEMPAYWRLLNWVRNQSIDRLQQRAQKSAVFTDFVQEPDKNRGRLVHLRLHLMRSLAYETPDSPIGIKRLYEAWGWTDEAHPWLYVVVFPECPPGMPMGPDAKAEASFDGYFLKLMSYEPHQSPGKPLFAPLLLGRIVWHPVRSVSSSSDSTWFWMTAAAGGFICLLAVVRWVIANRSARLTSEIDPAQSDSRAVQSWLEQAEAAANSQGQSFADSVDNPDEHHDSA